MSKLCNCLHFSHVAKSPERIQKCSRVGPCAGAGGGTTLGIPPFPCKIISWGTFLAPLGHPGRPCQIYTQKGPREYLSKWPKCVQAVQQSSKFACGQIPRLDRKPNLRQLCGGPSSYKGGTLGFPPLSLQKHLPRYLFGTLGPPLEAMLKTYPKSAAGIARQGGTIGQNVDTVTTIRMWPRRQMHSQPAPKLVLGGTFLI